MHVAMHIATQKTQKETNVHGNLCHHFSIVKFLWIAFERKNRDRAYRLAPDHILDLQMFHIIIIKVFHSCAIGCGFEITSFYGIKLSANTTYIFIKHLVFL